MSHRLLTVLHNSIELSLYELHRPQSGAFPQSAHGSAPHTGAGVYIVQQFVTPQLANVEPFAPFNPRELRAAAADFSLFAKVFGLDVYWL